MQRVKIGDRVSWYTKPDLHGTIKDIFLTEHPFWVFWDNGKDDWYRGCDLRKLPMPSTDQESMGDQPQVSEQ